MLISVYILEDKEGVEKFKNMIVITYNKPDSLNIVFERPKTSDSDEPLIKITPFLLTFEKAYP